MGVLPKNRSRETTEETKIPERKASRIAEADRKLPDGDVDLAHEQPEDHAHRECQ